MNEQTAGGTSLLDPSELLTKELEITPGSVVGDLGCGGAGYFAITAGKLVGKTGKVYAVDVQKKILENLKTRAEMEKLENIETVWSNLEIYSGTKVSNDALDVGLLVNVLFQNKNRLAILKESTRMVKKGGKLLVIDWNEGRYAFGPQPQSKVSKEEVQKIAGQAGLIEMKSFQASKWHYGLIFTK